LLTAWTVIRNSAGLEGIGGSGRLLLPGWIAARVHNGQELGDVMDDILNVQNIKHLV